MGASCQRVIAQGGIIQEKMFVRRQKSRGQLPWGKFKKVNCQGVIVQRENIPR